ncbi:MAG TPA: hypothetical protein VJA46_07715 [Acidimicrobiia bacterium]|nr:hypothetical protein [Acidimicrobiia bacterium]
MSATTSTNDRRQRRMLRAAAPLAGLLVAALLVWQGSNAAFSATTDNTGDAWATGNLLLTNNGGGTVYAGTTSALFTESNLKPGNTGFKCITVQSGGSLAGNLRLYRGAITGTNSAALSAVLDVTVDAVAVAASTNVQANCTGYTGGSGGALYNGTLSALPSTYAGASGLAVAGGTQRVAYRIGWTLNSGAGNSVQSSSAAADLVWEIN